MTKLEQLRDQLAQSIDAQGRLLLDKTFTELAWLQESLDAVVGAPDLLIDAASLELEPHALLVRGTGDLGPLGRPSVILRLAVSGEHITVALESVGQLEATIAAARGLLAGTLASALEPFDQLSIDTFSLQMAPGGNGFRLHIGLRGTWSPKLGPARFELGLSRLEVQRSDGRVRAAISGSLMLSGIRVEARLPLDGDLQLEASLDQIDLETIAGAFGLSLRMLPSAIPTRLGKGVLFIGPLSGRAPVVSLHAPLPPLGDVRVVIAEVGAAWTVMVAAELPGDWSFSRLHRALAPLDVLLDVVTFDHPGVVISSVTQAQFPYPSRAEPSATLAVSEGAELRAALALRGFGLDVVADLFKLDRVPLVGDLVGDMSQLSLRGSIRRKLVLVPSLLEVDGFELEIRPTPFSVRLAGVADVSLFGERLPRFLVGMEISEGVTAIVFDTEEPWVRPLGLPKLTIEDLVVELSPAPLAMAFRGQIALRDRRMNVAARFVGHTPTMLVGDLDGEMPLAPTLTDLVGVDLVPAALRLTIQDFHVYVVPNPLGETIGGVHFPRGLSLDGTIRFLGLGFRAVVRVDPDSGVFASGRLAGPIRLDPVLSISDASGGGPYVTLDTTARPILKVSARVGMLGLAQEVDASLDEDGLAFSIQQQLGPVAARLDGRLQEGLALSTEGSADFHLSGSIGPVRLFDGGPDLGTIRLDADFRGRVTVAARPDHSSLRARGDFDLLGIRFTVPELALTVAPRSLAELPEILLKWIREHSKKIFAELFESAALWVDAIAKKVIGAVSDVAMVLREHFQETPEKIAAALRKSLDATLEETTKALKRLGETTTRIAKILTDFGEPVEDVARALKNIDEPVEEIAKALQALNVPFREVGEILEKVGVPRSTVNTVVRLIFPMVPDVSWPPHIKHLKAPHIKHLKAPHIKHLKAPHIKFGF